MTRISPHNVTAAVALALLFTIAAAMCRPAPASRASANDIRIAAANHFTELYSQSRLSRWDVRASAAGADCTALFITTSIILEDSMIEAMHYGAGPYDIYEGGVSHFYRDRAFRGVAYRDASGRIWTYGAVSPIEAEAFVPCRKGAL